MADSSNTDQAGRINSTASVWVGCKLPHGLICETFFPTPPLPPEANSVLLLNARALMPPRVKRKFVLKGANSVMNDYSVRGLAQVQYPFAVTAVPADAWEEWFALHKDDDAVRNGFIFAVDRERDAKATARERESERTGLEPLNPVVEKDPRMPSQRELRPEQRVEHDAAQLAKFNQMNGRDL